MGSAFMSAIFLYRQVKIKVLINIIIKCTKMPRDLALLLTSTHLVSIYIYIYPPFFRVFITSAGHYFTSPREQQIIQAFMFIPFRIFGFLIFDIL